MLNRPQNSIAVRGLILLLTLSLMSLPVGCGGEDQAEVSLEAFLNSSGGPPEPLPSDALMKGKADVIALPTISVTVWAVGALIVYMGTQEVFRNTISDFEIVLQGVFGQSVDWSWAEEIGEPQAQADHLSEALNRIAYRSEVSDFYSINGNDYLRFLSMASPTTLLDQEKLDGLIAGQVLPWGGYAKEFFKSLQAASIQARHLDESGAASGLCARAWVRSVPVPEAQYYGFAKASGKVDIIPAIVLASLKATIRCGMYDGDVQEYVYSYYDVGAMDAIPNTFISHMLKSVALIYRYVNACTLPPSVEVTVDAGDCVDPPF